MSIKINETGFEISEKSFEIIKKTFVQDGSKKISDRQKPYFEPSEI